MIIEYGEYDLVEITIIDSNQIHTQPKFSVGMIQDGHISHQSHRHTATHELSLSDIKTK